MEIQEIILDNLKEIRGQVATMRAEIGVVLDKHEKSINDITQKCIACDVEKKTKDSVYYKVGSFIMTAVLAATLVISFSNIFKSDEKQQTQKTAQINGSKQ